MASERATRLTDSFNEIDPALGDEVYWQTVEATAEKFLLEERRETAFLCREMVWMYGDPDIDRALEALKEKITKKFGLENEAC